MSSMLTPKDSTEDDLNFLAKSSKSSRLSSLFSDPLRKDSMDSSSNSSLRYVPPKQPKPGSSDLASNISGACTRAAISGSSNSTPASANPVLVVIKVEAFILKDNAFSSIGAAVCCVLSGKQGSAQSHTLLLYQNPKIPLTRVTINGVFSFMVQTRDCAFFRDVENRCWSVKAGPDQLLDLLRQVGVCRVLSSGSGGAVMVQPLSPSPSDTTVLLPGDWAEVTAQPLVVKRDGALDKLPPDAACERVRVCVADSAGPQQEGGSGGAWWASALQGAGRGDRRLALLFDKSQNGNEVRACEVVVEKIKKRKRISKSPAAPSSPTPSLALAGCRERGAAAAAGEAVESTEPDAVTALPPAASETTQDDPRARVLSRIARVGQSVFGAPPAASTVTAAAGVTPTQAATERPSSASAAVTTSKPEETSLSDSELDWEDGLVTQGQSASSTQLGESCTAAAAAAAISAPVTAVPSSACSSHSQRSPAATPHATHTPLPHPTRAGGDAGVSPHPVGLSCDPNTFYPISSPQPGYVHQAPTAAGQTPYLPADAPNITPHMRLLTAPGPSYDVIGSSNGPLPGHAPYEHQFSGQGPPSAVHLSPFPCYPTQYHDHSSTSNTLYQSRYHRQPPLLQPQYGAGAALPTDPTLSLIFSESRAQNTELRIALAKMADQVTDLQAKMSAVQNSSRTGEAHTGLYASLDARLTELMAAQQIRDSAGADTLAALEQQVRHLHQALTAALGGDELPSQGDECALSVLSTLKLVGQLVRLIQAGKLASAGFEGERICDVEVVAKDEREAALEKEVKDLRDQMDEIDAKYSEVNSEIEMMRLKEKSCENLHERWLECGRQEAHYGSELLPLTECAPSENDPIWLKAYKAVLSMNWTLQNKLKQTEDVACGIRRSTEEEASAHEIESVALKEQIEHLKTQISQIKVETKEIKAVVVDENELFLHVDPQQLSQDVDGANEMHPPQLPALENSLRPEQRVAALEPVRLLLQEGCKQQDEQREQHQLKQQEEVEQQKRALDLQSLALEQLREEDEQRKLELIQKENELQQERQDLEEERTELEEQKHQQKQMLEELKRELVQHKHDLEQREQELKQQKLDWDERRGQADSVLEGERGQTPPDSVELETLKMDKERLEAELQLAQEELSGLSVLRMKEREQSEERLAELNQSRAGVELELLELSGAQHTMEREVEALRQQTIQLRQLARARRTVSENTLPGSGSYDGRSKEGADEGNVQAEEQFERARRKKSICTQTACCHDTESSGKCAEGQQGSVAAGVPVKEVEATLKRVMNAVYKGSKAKFGAEQHYDGNSIRQALLAVIKETTFQYLTSITLEKEKDIVSIDQSNAREQVEASKIEDPLSANHCNGVGGSAQTKGDQTVAPPHTQQNSSWQQSIPPRDRFPANDCRVERQEEHFVEVNDSNNCDSAEIGGMSDVNGAVCDVVDGTADRQETTPVSVEEVVRGRENCPNRTAIAKNRSGDDDGGEYRSDNDDGEEDNAAENIKYDATKRIGAADDGSDSSSGEYDISKDTSSCSEEPTSSERVVHLEDEAPRTDLRCKALGEDGLCEAGEGEGSDESNFLAGGGGSETRDTSTLIEEKKSNQIFSDESIGVCIENNAILMENEIDVSPGGKEPLSVDPKRPEDEHRPFPPTQEGDREKQLRGAPSVHQDPLGQPHQVSSTPLPHPSGEEKVWSLSSHPPPLPLFSDDEDDDNWLS